MKKLEMRENYYRLPFGCQMTKDPMYEDVYVFYVSAGMMSGTVVLSARSVNHESSLSFGKDMAVGIDMESGEYVYINCAHILKVVPKTMVTVTYMSEGSENIDDIIVDAFLIKKGTTLNIISATKPPKGVLR